MCWPERPNLTFLKQTAEVCELNLNYNFVTEPMSRHARQNVRFLANLGWNRRREFSLLVRFQVIYWSGRSYLRTNGKGLNILKNSRYMLRIGNVYKNVDKVHGLGQGSITEMFHTV